MIKNIEQIFVKKFHEKFMTKIFEKMIKKIQEKFTMNAISKPGFEILRKCLKGVGNAIILKPESKNLGAFTKKMRVKSSKS